MRSSTGARMACAGAALLVGVMLLQCPVAAAGQPDEPDQVEAGVAPGAPVPDPRPGQAFADPAVAELQRTASKVQGELGELTKRIHAAEKELRKATDKLAAAKAERRAADAVVAARQDEVDEVTAALYSSLGQPGGLRVLLGVADPADFLHGSGLVERLRAEQNRKLAGAVRRQRAALDAERTAAAAQQEANERAVELRRRTDDARNRAAAISAELRGVATDTNAAVVEQQRGQRRRNERTAANWREYLGRLADAGVVAPPAAALADPSRLPAGMRPVPGADGPQRGVAQVTVASGQRLLVLPKEIVDAVSAAVDTLGAPYAPTGAGPAAYSCAGLVRTVYGGAGIPLPAAPDRQLAVLTPVDQADAQPGDLVFLGPAEYGVQGVGIVLDDRTMLTADARLAGVVVTDLPPADTVLGIARPALPRQAAGPVPRPRDDSTGLRWRCGGVELPPRAPGEAAGAWGGYPNGFIPMTTLCPIGVGAHVLRCDAATSYQAMSAAFRTATGRELCITDSYRTFDAQVRLYAVKPGLAAVPGTSNHGWGLAVDLCGGVESFATAEHAWMRANAPAFGWSNPPWARPGGGREEPWHWEFVGR